MKIFTTAFATTLAVTFTVTLFCLVFTNRALAANCGSEVVNWPVGVNKSCGAQLIYNGGAALGANSSPLMDTVNSSEANFVCTERGWVYVSGVCYIKRNLKCVQQKLNVTAPQLGVVDDTMIQDILDTTVTAVRAKVVAAVNECDSQGAK